MRVIAVDPSLTRSGWALFSIDRDTLLGVGVLTALTSQQPLSKRLDFLQTEVSALMHRLELGSSDYLVCEGPAPLVLNPQSALKVEQVRGIFESVARVLTIKVPGRLNPRTVQSELLGMRGKQLPRREVKEWAVMTAERLYGEELKRLSTDSSSGKSKVRVVQDVIDAVLIGALARTKIDTALRTDGDVVQAFAGGSRSGGGRGWTMADIERRK